MGRLRPEKPAPLAAAARAAAEQLQGALPAILAGPALYSALRIDCFPATAVRCSCLTQQAAEETCLAIACIRNCFGLLGCLYVFPINVFPDIA